MTKVIIVLRGIRGVNETLLKDFLQDTVNKLSEHPAVEREPNTKFLVDVTVIN